MGAAAYHAFACRFAMVFAGIDLPYKVAGYRRRLTD